MADVDIPTIRHPRLVRLFELWRGARDGHRLPAARAMNQPALADMMPNLLFVEVRDEPVRYRYLKVGAALRRLISIEVEGRYVDEIRNPVMRRIAIRAYAEVIAGAGPTCVTYRFFRDWWFGSYERLLLPLAEDGYRIDMILGAIYPRVGRMRRPSPGKGGIWEDA